MKKDLNNKGEILLYKAEDGQFAIDVRFKEETLWLSLNQIAMLFSRDKSVISRHISKIFREKELDRTLTVAKFATVQKEGEREIETPKRTCVKMRENLQNKNQQK